MAQTPRAGGWRILKVDASWGLEVVRRHENQLNRHFFALEPS